MNKAAIIFARALAAVSAQRARAGILFDRAIASNVALGIFVSLIFKLFRDDATASEEKEIVFGKAQADVASADDQLTYDASKLLDEAASITSDQRLSVAKSIADASAIGDQQTSVISKIVSDGILALDTFLSSIDGGQDTTTAEDESLSTDQSTLSLAKVLASAGVSIDAALILLGKDRSDQGLLTDVGFLRSQGYCDFTYFAEDYVGESRTFT